MKKNEELILTRKAKGPQNILTDEFKPLREVHYKDGLSLSDYIEVLEKQNEGFKTSLKTANDKMSDLEKIISSQDESIKELKQALLEVNNKIEKEGEIL